MTNRIDARFAQLKAENRAALVTFLTAGDPDPATSKKLFAGLAAHGADLIEIGVPFTDPMADGPTIQEGSVRALKAGTKLNDVFDIVASLRTDDDTTPIVLMGYFNPIFATGPAAFCKRAAEAGVDGLIVVDLSPEEAGDLAPAAQQFGLHIIRLATPTTDAARLPAVLDGAGGFLYYVSITGVTGTKSADMDAVAAHLDEIRRSTDLPLGVGFGIATPEQAATVARFADAAVVGSALVRKIEDGLGEDGALMPGAIADVHGLVGQLAEGVRGARRASAAE